MRKCLLALLIICSVSGFAQTNDTELNGRLASYMRYNQALDFENLLDYVHPSIFKILSRKQMLEVFQKTFDNEVMTIQLDSTSVTRVSAPYNSNQTTYRKVDYYLEMRMQFKDTSLNMTKEVQQVFSDNLKKSYPNARISFDAPNRIVFIKANNIMVAIRDANRDWMFLGAEKRQEALLRKLFPEAVINHFKLL